MVEIRNHYLRWLICYSILFTYIQIVNKVKTVIKSATNCSATNEWVWLTVKFILFFSVSKHIFLNSLNSSNFYSWVIKQERSPLWLLSYRLVWPFRIYTAPKLKSHELLDCLYGNLSYLKWTTSAIFPTSPMILRLRSLSSGNWFRHLRNRSTPFWVMNRSEFSGVSSVTFHRQLQQPWRKFLENKNLLRTNCVY